MKYIILLAMVMIYTVGCQKHNSHNRQAPPKPVPHEMHCKRVDSDDTPISVYRCISDEAICYRIGGEAVQCAFGTTSRSEG